VSLRADIEQKVCELHLAGACCGAMREISAELLTNFRHDIINIGRHILPVARPNALRLTFFFFIPVNLSLKALPAQA